jgi:hypothetical protein
MRGLGVQSLFDALARVEAEMEQMGNECPICRNERTFSDVEHGQECGACRSWGLDLVADASRRGENAGLTFSKYRKDCSCERARAISGAMKAVPTGVGIKFTLDCGMVCESCGKKWRRE